MFVNSSNAFSHDKWAKTLDKCTNIFNTKSQLRYSSHLIVHPHLPKHHQLSNQQQRLSLLLETKIKKTGLYSQNTTQNDAKITNSDNIQSCGTVGIQNYSIKNNSTPNHNTQRFSTTSVSMLNLHTTMILPPVGK